MDERGWRLVRITAVAAVVVLVACSGTIHIPASGDGSASPGVVGDCGELAAEPCRYVLEAAVRLVPPGDELISAAVTPWHGEFPCDTDNPCPSFPPHYAIGAELRLAERDSLELNCVSPAVRYLPFEGEKADPQAEKVLSTLVVCGAVDEAESRSATVAYRIVDETDGEVNWYDGAAGVGNFSGGAAPSCSHPVHIGFPFSFYTTGNDGHGHPRGGLREVFRSEDITDRPGEFYFDITIHSAADVTVDPVDPSSHPACFRGSSGP